MKMKMKMTVLDWLYYSGHCNTGASARRLCHQGAVVQGFKKLNIDDVPEFPTSKNPIKIGKRKEIICCDPKLMERIYNEQITSSHCG